MPHRKVTVYDIQAVSWVNNDEFYDRLDWDSPNSEDVSALDDYYEARPLPLKVFLSREKAEAHRYKLEHRERKGKHPFAYGDFDADLSEFSSLAPKQLIKRVQALNVTPPRPSRRGRLGATILYEWWTDVEDGLAETQLQALWDLFDRIQFFEVLPLDMELEA